MIFHTLRMHRFKGFRKETTFTFRGQGLYLITGDNQAEPDLGANGTGKSSMIDALIWCVTGKTVRGMRASDVVTWHEDGNASVDLVFEDHGKISTLTRRQSPNALLLKGPAKAEPVDQKTVDDVFGTTFDTLVSTLVFPQFDNVFFDHDASKQATLLSSLENLDVWQQLAEQERARRKTLGDRLDTLNDYVKVLEGEQEAFKRQVEDLKVRSAAFRLEQRELKKRRTEQVAVLERDITAARIELRTASRAAKDVESKSKKDESSLRQKEQERAQFVQEERTLRFLAVEHEKVLEKEPPDAELRGSLQRCPTCDRPYADADEHKQAHKRAVKQYKRERAAAQEALDGISAELKRLLKAKKQCDAELASLEDAVDSHAIDFTRTELLRAQAKLATLEGELAAVKVDELEDDPFELMIVDARANLLGARDKVAAARKLHKRLSVHAGDAEFWSSEFPKLRFWLMDQLASEFEICVNNTLPLLGLHRWRAEISTTKVQKNGDTRAAFTPIIYSPTSPSGVPWRAWSGGETQRLRIAGHVAWKDLVRSHLGIDINAEFYDEPTRGMTQQGAEDLMEFLQSRAEGGREIYVIDHHTQQSGFFDDILTVVKTEKGSFIV